MQTVREWLEQLGLPEYAEVFARNDVDLEALCLLNEAELEQLGVSLGHRKKLLKALAQLNVAAAPALASNRVQDPLPGSQERGTPEAERRQLSVLFCDLMGSTELSTRLDPEQLRDLMQAYQRACTEVIERYEGHVAQYLGDGLMVYFGWPRAHEDDAVRAIRAGLDITEVVSSLPATTPLCTRVGIHTGLVVVGETGQGDASIPKAAVGQTPNIAARLQALAAPASVLVSERTQALAGGLFEYADLGTPALKGVAEPLRVFRAIGARAVDSRFEGARSELALTPLVGREEELALLLRRWHEAKEGEGQVLLIVGEPGIGKSRMIRVLQERLASERYAILRYQCSPYHVNSALYPVIEQLGRAAGFAREDTLEQKLDKMQGALTATKREASASAALFAALLSLPLDRYPPLNLSPQKQKELTLEALAEQIEVLAQRQPVLMIYEDAHWIDATTQEALDLLVPRLQGLPVLLIVTYRPEYAPKWAEHAHVTLLGLSRLGRRQAASLVTKVTAGKALPPDVLEQILAHTDGVPLFVEELTKSILESQLLSDAGDRYALDGPLPALEIPTTLRDSLIARLDRLPSVREVAQIGACIGREFPYDLLAAVSPLSAHELDHALEQLTDSGLLFRRGTLLDTNYTFKHALVQDAAYDSLLKSKRAQLHGRIASALEKEMAERIVNAPELLAHHHSEAGNFAAAVPLWRQAGEEALTRVALKESAGHFQKGLALIEQMPPSRGRDELELSIREPLTAAWTGLRGYAAAEVAANAAAILHLARNQDKPESLLMGLYGSWMGAFTQGRIAESLEWPQRLLAEGDETQQIALRIFGHVAAMSSHFYLGQLLEAREQGNSVRSLYDPQRAGTWMQLTAQDLRTSVGVYAANWNWMLGYPDQARQASNDAVAHARELGHTFNLAWALIYGAYAFDYLCEPLCLLERASEADRIGREQSIPFVYHILAPLMESLGRLRGGELPEAISLLRQTVESWSQLGGRIRLPYLKSALAEALARRGEFDAALRLIAESLQQVERPGWQERVHLAEILRLKGWILMRQGREEEAEAQLRISIDWSRRQHARSWELRSSTTLAELLAERGQRDAARALLTPIYNWFTEGFETQDLKRAKRLLDELA